MINFTCSMPTKIFFGKDSVKKIGKAVKKSGASNVLICHGSDRVKKSGLFDSVINELKSFGISFTAISGIEPNPRIESVREGVEIARSRSVDFVLPIGGGSVLDCAKAIAAGYYCDGDPWDMFTGKVKIKKALPVGTVLTLAATGSEMNGNAVVSNLDEKRKLGIHSSLVRPVFSILDPVLTFSVPEWHTASGIADIMVHVFEQYFSTVEGTYLQDRMCDAVIKTCINYAPVVLRDPKNYEARANIMWAGTIGLNGLLAYGRVGDWASHMIEHAVSAFDDVTHGAGLAVISPYWMKKVMNETNLKKFTALGHNVWNIDDSSMNEHETAIETVNRFSAFFTSIGLPSSLEELGVKKDSLPAMAESVVENGPVGNFCSLSGGDVLSILENSF